MRWNSEIAQNDKTKVRYDRVEVERQNIESNVYADKVGFDEENIKGYTRKVLLSYLNQIIPEPLIAIAVYVQGYEKKRYYINEVPYHVKELTWNDKRYQILSRWNESNVSKNGCI